MGTMELRHASRAVDQAVDMAARGASAVVDAILGPAFAGVLVRDGYAADDHFPGPQQRCWAHVWREIDTLERLWPQHPALASWMARLRTLYQAATGLRPAAERGRDARPSTPVAATHSATNGSCWPCARPPCPTTSPAPRGRYLAPLRG